MFVIQRNQVKMYLICNCWIIMIDKYTVIFICFCFVYKNNRIRIRIISFIRISVQSFTNEFRPNLKNGHP